YVVGSLILGIVNDRFNTQITTGIVLSLYGVCSFAFPWNRNLYGLLATAFIMQMFGVMITCIVYVWVIRLWGIYNGSFFQGVSMAWGVGAFLAPIVAAPFLTEISETDSTDNPNYADEFDNDIPSEKIGELRIQWAYAIAGSISTFCALIIFIMFFIQRSDKPHPSKIEGDKARTKLSMYKKISILTLIALLIHFYL